MDIGYMKIELSKQDTFQLMPPPSQISSLATFPLYNNTTIIYFILTGRNPNKNSRFRIVS